MGKLSILVWYNLKSHGNILHAPVCALLDTPINQGQYGLAKFRSIFAEFFKDPYKIHAWVAVATPQQREIWTHQPPVTVVTETEDIISYEKDSVMHTLIHLEDSDDKEDGHINSPSKPLSLDSTREPIHPSENIY